MRKRLGLSVQVAVTEGGGSEVLIFESNQNHATIKDAEVCPCLPASMGLGGGYVPMILAYGFDARCKWVAEEKSQTVTATGGGGQLRLSNYDLSNG